VDQLAQFTQSANALLTKAQELFLKRDESDPFLGVRLDPEGPHLRFEPSGPGVWIELSPSTVQYPNQALHQIAHEVIHLLAPCREPPTVMLEEGLAVWFSIYGPEFPSADYRQLAIDDLYRIDGPVNYRDALELYKKADPDAIVKLRTREPRLHLLNPNLIQEVLPGTDPSLASRWCERRAMRLV
jgi:hypothetical protein